MRAAEKCRDKGLDAQLAGPALVAGAVELREKPAWWKYIRNGLCQYCGLVGAVQTEDELICVECLFDEEEDDG